MLEILDWTKLDEAARKAALARAVGSETDVTDYVRPIVEAVKTRGDDAVREYAAKFDKVDAPVAKLSREKIESCVAALDPALRRALEESIANVTAFHKAQRPAPVRIETMPGVVCEQNWRPIERVGLYIPAGTAPLFSTLIMLAVPSALAGCKKRVLCTPPFKGEVNPIIVAAAGLCGIDEIYPVGGPWSIAAMAYGTQAIPKVDKIFGPGNSYVTAAKQLVSEDSAGAAIDMPAGPSEVMVIADNEANPAWVAADMLAQAEHGADSQAVLLTPDRAMAEKVKAELEAQLKELSRAETTAKALAYARLIVVPDLDAAARIADLYAPEHLILEGAEGAAWPAEMGAKVLNASSIFVGAFSPETAGDYASGTNHVLPTYGYARAYSGLSLFSFMKSVTTQTLSRQGLEALAPTLIAMARAEGLDAHARAVELRVKKG